MKYLPGSGFTEMIEYTSEVVLRTLGLRNPQRYRLMGSQLVDGRYNFSPKGLPSSK